MRLGCYTGPNPYGKDIAGNSDPTYCVVMGESPLLLV